MALTREFNIEVIDDVAREVLKHAEQKTILFYGKMGIGKTTLISALVRALGGNDEASSPTFSIVNEYQVENDKVYHFDCYRLKDAYEALDIGIEDYFDSNNWIFIEWPDKIDAILPSSVTKLELTIGENDQRRLVLESDLVCN